MRSTLKKKKFLKTMKNIYTGMEGAKYNPSAVS